MKKHIKHKDSGVEWIGEIPDSWEVNKLKYLINGKLTYGANEVAEEENQSHPRYIRITDFGDDGNLRDDTYKSLNPEQANEYLLEDGDILFARSGATVGKTFQYKNKFGKACFAGYLIKASPSDKILSDFLYYFTKSFSYENWRNSIFNQATIQNIGADKYSELFVTVPKIMEQIWIVKYLDKRTNSINSLIQKKQKLISLLQEERTALINHAVTKGIDPKAKMKPSGIEWIGEVPEHWEVNKFSRIAFYQEGPGLRNWQFTQEGTKVICVTNITEDGIDFSLLNRCISNEEYTTSYQHFTVKRGDYLLASSGASWGKIAMYDSDEKVILNTSTIRFNTSDSNKVSKRYIFWLMKSELVNEQLSLLLTGSCQPNFGPSHLSKLFVIYPKIKEQNEIIEYIEKSTSKIEKTVTKIKSEIQLLEEYKTSLINEVVTGKICVLPDEFSSNKKSVEESAIK